MRAPRGAPEGESRLAAVRTRLLPSEGSLIAACLREAKPSKIHARVTPLCCRRHAPDARERDGGLARSDSDLSLQAATRDPAWQKRAWSAWFCGSPRHSGPSKACRHLGCYCTAQGEVQLDSSSRSTFPFWDAPRPFLLPAAGKIPSRSVAVDLAQARKRGWSRLIFGKARRQSFNATVCYALNCRNASGARLPRRDLRCEGLFQPTSNATAIGIGAALDISSGRHSHYRRLCAEREPTHCACFLCASRMM